MRRILASISLLALLSAGKAYAHTFVFINNNPADYNQTEYFVSSTPAPNQAVDKAPDAVMLTFSRPIDPGKSSLGVYDLYGTDLTDGKVTVNGPSMSANLPLLQSGKYAVKWKTRCMCADSNELRDEFHFTVK